MARCLAKRRLHCWSRRIRHAAGKNPPEHDTHVLQCLKVLAGAVNLRLGEILYRPVFGSKFGSKNEAMQDFVASFLFRPSATAEVLHVQLATPIVKCEPAWKLRKINVALMFNHKRSHPRTLAACGIMSIMMFFCCLYCHYYQDIMDSMWVVLSLSSWYYCVNLGHNAIIIMKLLFLFGARYHYHHDIIGAQWGNLMIPLYDIIVFLFLGGFFPRRGPRITLRFKVARLDQGV